MIDVTEEFFAGIAGRDDPALRKATGTLRFELSARRRDRALARRHRQGHRSAHSVLPRPSSARRVIRSDKTLFEEIVRGDANTTTAMLRGEVSVEGDLELLLLFQRLIVSMSEGGRERRSGQDPRRQHVRRERHARRHRSVGDRPDRSVLVRHALLVEVGAHDQRSTPHRAVDRRHAVLRDALLPRSGYGNRLRRLEAVRDPAAHGRRRVPRRAHAAQSRRRTREADDSHRHELRLRRPVRGQGRAREAGQVLRARRDRKSRARVPAGDVRALDDDLPRPSPRASTRTASRSRSRSNRTANGRRRSTSWPRCSNPRTRGAAAVREGRESRPPEHGT